MRLHDPCSGFLTVIHQSFGSSVVIFWSGLATNSLKALLSHRSRGQGGVGLGRVGGHYRELGLASHLGLATDGHYLKFMSMKGFKGLLNPWSFEPFPRQIVMNIVLR